MFRSYGFMGISNSSYNLSSMPGNHMNSQNHMGDQGYMHDHSEHEDYKGNCCIKEPCSYCQTKEEGCDCMEDVINGDTPCRTCVDGIIKGDGLFYLKQYFVDSLDSLYEDREELKSLIDNQYRL